MRKPRNTGSCSDHEYEVIIYAVHAVQASAAEVRSQPQPFVFAPHRSSPLSPQSPPYQHQHTPYQHQGNPHQHSLSRTLSAEAESPAESQMYSLRSRVAPRVPAEPLGPHQSYEGLQKPVHKVHHFFMCHSDQVPLCSQTQSCASVLSCVSG